MDEIDGDQWQCDKCTYINDNKDLTCIMCYTVRTATKDLPVTWQWQAADQWIPYDLPSCLQIESAFQSGKKSVHLTEGYFAQNHGYSVSFINISPPTKSTSHRQHSRDESQDDNNEDGNEDNDHSQSDDAKQTQSTHNQVKYRFQQTNTDTGNVRRVRRLANDDDGMYITVDPSQLTTQEKCGVCAETLLGDDDDEADLMNTSGTSTSTSASTSTSSLPSSTTELSKSGSTSKSKSTSTSISTSTSTPSDIVKLPKCAIGHSFHRTCIAQWLKLKDHCPFCQKRI